MEYRKKSSHCQSGGRLLHNAARIYIGARKIAVKGQTKNWLARAQDGRTTDGRGRTNARFGSARSRSGGRPPVLSRFDIPPRQ